MVISEHDNYMCTLNTTGISGGMPKGVARKAGVPKGTFAKLRPVTSEFASNISDPKASPFITVCLSLNYP